MKSLVLAVALAVSGATYADDSRIADAVKMFPATPGYGYVMEDGEWEWKGSPSTFNAIELTEASKQHKYVHTVEHKHYGWSGKYFWVFINGQFYSIERSLIDGNNVADSIKDILTDRMVSEYTAELTSQVEEAEQVASMVNNLAQTGMSLQQIADLTKELLGKDLIINAKDAELTDIKTNAVDILSEEAPSFTWDENKTISENIARGIAVVGEGRSAAYLELSKEKRRAEAAELALANVDITADNKAAIAAATPGIEAAARQGYITQESANALIAAAEKRGAESVDITTDNLQAIAAATPGIEEAARRGYITKEAANALAAAAKVAANKLGFAQGVQKVVSTANSHNVGVVVDVKYTRNNAGHIIGARVDSVSLTHNEVVYEDTNKLYGAGFDAGYLKGRFDAGTTISFDGNARAERLSYISHYDVTINGEVQRFPASIVDLNVHPTAKPVTSQYSVAEYAHNHSQGYQAAYSAELNEELGKLQRHLQSQLQDVVEAAWADGYEQGYNDGYEDGYSDGHFDGYNEGYADGKAGRDSKY